METFTRSLQQCLQLRHHMGRTARRALKVTKDAELPRLEQSVELGIDLHRYEVITDTEAPKVACSGASLVSSEYIPVTVQDIP